MSTKTRDTYPRLYVIARENKKVENKMTSSIKLFKNFISI
jgi:hypothetical protein